MTEPNEHSPADDVLPLPEAVLRRIIGGARADEAKPMDGDRAAALTAGADLHAETGAPGTIAKPGPDAASGPDQAPAKADSSLPAQYSKDVANDFKTITGVKLKGGDEFLKKEWKYSQENPDYLGAGTTKVTIKSTAADAEKKAAEKQQDNDRGGPKGPVLDSSAHGGDAPRSVVDTAKELHTISAGTVKTYEDHLHGLQQQNKPASEISAAKSAYDQAVQQHAEHTKLLETVTAQAKAEASKPAPAAVGAPAPGVPKPGAQDAAGKGDAADGHKVAAELDKALSDAKAKADAAAKIKQDEAKKAEQAQKNGEMVRTNLTHFGNKLVSEALTEAAKRDADAHGHYVNTIKPVITADSSTDDIVVSNTGGVLKTHKGIDATTVTAGTESWSSDLGVGAKVVTGAVTRYGGENVTTLKDEQGNVASVTKDRILGTASHQAKAGFASTNTSFDADASIQGALHGEISHSVTETTLGFEHTTTHSAALHGEAGAKAGLHLGFDGVNGQVKASAEITASATVTQDIKVGEGKVTIGADVFVQARVEARAEVDVSFDPKTGKVKMKAGGGFEANAGVGADVNVGTFSKEGNGASATGHFKAGAIGVKFEPDISIENGKVDVKLTVGGYLGVGGTYDINIKGDFDKACKNTDKAAQVISDHPVLAVGAAYIYGWTFVSGFFS